LEKKERSLAIPELLYILFHSLGFICWIFLMGEATETWSRIISSGIAVILFVNVSTRIAKAVRGGIL
jgi:hypothetical protein